MVNSVIYYFQDIAKTECELYATRYIFQLTGLEIRDEEKGILELLPYYTKRKIYERYWYKDARIAKTDSKCDYINMCHSLKNRTMKNWENFQNSLQLLKIKISVVGINYEHLEEQLREYKDSNAIRWHAYDMSRAV